MTTTTKLTPSGKRVLKYLKAAGIGNIHDALACQAGGARPCPIHNPVPDCPMNDWKMYWRVDRHILERICEHGIGHPDHSGLHFMIKFQNDSGIHGCCGCCSHDCAWSVDE